MGALHPNSLVLRVALILVKNWISELYVSYWDPFSKCIPLKVVLGFARAHCEVKFRPARVYYIDTHILWF